MMTTQLHNCEGIRGCHPEYSPIANRLRPLVTSLRFALGRLSARAPRCSGWLLSGRGGVPKVPTPDTPPSPFRTFRPRMPTGVPVPSPPCPLERGASHLPSGFRTVCIDTPIRSCMKTGSELGGAGCGPEGKRPQIGPGDESARSGVAMSGALKATSAS
jgi:hypothetical protein